MLEAPGVSVNRQKVNRQKVLPVVGKNAVEGPAVPHP